MSLLLVQGCSKSKNKTSKPLPALELYSGYFFKIIKKARRDGVFDEQIDICILSAEYGLIGEQEEIEWYDRKMDSERVKELAPKVQDDFLAHAAEYESVVINVGKIYAQAIDCEDDRIPVSIYHIDGEGIGEKGRMLKELVRTTESTPSLQPVARTAEGKI